MTQPVSKYSTLSSPKKVLAATVGVTCLTSPEPVLFTFPGFPTGIYVLKPVFPETSQPLPGLVFQVLSLSLPAPF